MSAPLISVGQRFQAMEVKGEKVIVRKPAMTEEQNALFEKVVQLDSSICKDKQDLAIAKCSQEFLVTHAHSSQYMFQMKKCSNPDCKYCQEHPVRIPEKVFSNLSFLPMPRLEGTL